MKKNTEHSFSVPTTSTATGVSTSLHSGGSALGMGNALHGRDGMSTGGAGRWGRSGTVGCDGEVGHKQATQGGGGENGGLAQERKQEKKEKEVNHYFCVTNGMIG